jgi:fructokinase
VKNAYNAALNGQPFRCDLEALLGREVRPANDANCFAPSEAVIRRAARCWSATRTGSHAHSRTW